MIYAREWDTRSRFVYEAFTNPETARILRRLLPVKT